MKKHERKKVNKKESLGRRLNRDDNANRSVVKSIKAFPDGSINDSSKDFAEATQRSSQGSESKEQDDTNNFHGLFSNSSVTFSSSHYRDLPSEKYKQIVGAIETSSIPITPSEISQETKINHSTVKRYCRWLENKGFVKRVSHGYYVSVKHSVTFGSNGVSSESDSFRVHRLVLRLLKVVGEAAKWKKNLDVVKVTFQRYKNGTATVFVDCKGDYSLDYVAFHLLIEAAMRELDVSDWDLVEVQSPEFNKDFFGFQIHGAKAVTLRAFDGAFRRVYNKKYGLRDEIRLVGSYKAKDILAVLQGGVGVYNVLNLLFLNFKEWERYRKVAEGDAEAAKFQNRLVADAVSTMKRFLEEVSKQNRKGAAV